MNWFIIGSNGRFWRWWCNFEFPKMDGLPWPAK